MVVEILVMGCNAVNMALHTSTLKKILGPEEELEDPVGSVMM